MRPNRAFFASLTRLSGVAAVLLASGVVSGQQPAPRPASLEEQTASADEQMATIQRSIGEIETLRSDAQKKNEAIRLSCIEERLKAARASQTAAKQLRVDLGRFAPQNPGFGTRTLQRLLDLRLAAEAHLQDARACTDSSSMQFSLEVQVDKRIPPGATSQTPTFEAAPTLERPPLASPF